MNDVKAKYLEHAATCSDCVNYRRYATVDVCALGRMDGHGGCEVCEDTSACNDLRLTRVTAACLDNVQVALDNLRQVIQVQSEFADIGDELLIDIVYNLL
jgi:hypothetical protein